ncbi:hypothetical protein F7725_020336 [Dissostichus mawsoni]|uniref:Integrase catalytic domain-containing protein n=1 Tax=Dissostichus mawsoni TaxID=36200 RepID=A0A7J5YGA9_DISMA|nr:hypothetical protein F7725_020336 [Dissostichus mawsoni]
MKNQSDLEEVLAFVQHEIMTNGQMQDTGLVVSQDSIRRIIKLVDPQGVEFKTSHPEKTDPKVVASYFIKTVSGIGGCPERIRADRGTENVSVEEMQMFLRRNHPDSFAGERSFLLWKKHSKLAH